MGSQQFAGGGVDDADVQRRGKLEALVAIARTILVPVQLPLMTDSGIAQSDDRTWPLGSPAAHDFDSLAA
jgi:hypothetical protein